MPETSELTERLISIIESTPDYIGIATPDGMGTYMNESFRRILPEKYLSAFDRHEGIPISVFHPPEIFQLIQELAIPYAVAHGVWRGETALLDARGKSFPVLQTIIAHLGPDGKLAYISTIARDISEIKRVQAAIKESETRFRELVENAPEAIVLFDADKGTFVDANQNAVRLFGMTREELLMVTPAQVSPPTQPDGRSSEEAARAYIQQAVEGKTATFEWTHRTKGGRDIPCEVRLLRFSSADKKFIRGSVIDITERKQAEERFRALVENSSDVITIIDAAGKRLYVSPNIERLAGRNSEEALASADVFEFMHPDDIAGARSMIAEVAQKPGNRGHIELRIRHKNGSWLWVDAVAENRMDIASIRGIVINVRDVTEQHATAERIADSEERYRIMAEETGQLIYDWDILANTTAKWSGAIKQLTGYSPEEYRAFSNDEWYGHIHPDDLPKAMKILEETQKSGTHFRHEYRLRRKDGTYVLVEDSGSFLRNEAGTVHRMIGAIKDLSESLRAQEASERAEELARLNKVMVGRELKMIELKEENDRLKTELEKSGAAR